MAADGTSQAEPIVEVGCGVGLAADIEEAGREAARVALAGLRRYPPSAVLVFTSARRDAEALLRGVRAITGEAPVLGATAAGHGRKGGQIHDGEYPDAPVVAAIGSPFLSVRVGVGEGVSRHWRRALHQALSSEQLAPLFDGTGQAWQELARRGRSAFAFFSAPGETPSSGSYAFEILEALKRASLGRLPIFGGASACDWPRENDHVFGCGRAVRDGLVVAVFETELRFGLALAHGFRETDVRLTVTRCRGDEVLEFDGRPAAEAYAEAMGVTVAALEGQNPTNVTGRPLGSPDAAGQFIPYMARALAPGGGLHFNRSVAPGAVLSVMVADPQGALDAGPSALRTAMLRAGIVDPALAVAAICPTRFALYGDAAAEEVPRMVKSLAGAPLVGFRSWGEQGVTDDGVSNHTNAVVSVLVLGRQLSQLAQVARDNERLRESAERLQRRTQEELERQVAERTAQLVAANEERTRMVEQLMQADRLVAMGRLAAGVGHEINNPLTYVMSGLSVVADELADLVSEVAPGRLDDARETLDEMRDGLERIRRVVRDLKTFSRSDEEPLHAVAVKKMLESSVQMATNEIRHRAALVKEYGPTPPVLGNATRLGQVFLNLLVNAAQAIPEGAADRHRIRVVTSTDASGHALVEIHDTGTGIPPQDLERVFEPFYTTRQAHGANGLGLSISRNLVASMGGSVTVESRPGEGSCFRIRLPPAAQPFRTAAPGAGEQRRARVLVVDDDPLVLSAVRRTLFREHEVVGETSARAALARIAAGEAFDLILCDLMMPEMGGAEFHAELADLRPELAARTVYLTGGAFTPGGRRFLESVPNACIEKPFEPDDLRERVRALIEATAGGR